MLHIKSDNGRQAAHSPEFPVVTHNLDKLYRYCCMVSYQLPEIVFGNNKENDKRLFNLLQKAYIDTRYKNDYCINTGDLLALTEIVRKLNQLLKKE